MTAAAPPRRGSARWQVIDLLLGGLDDFVTQRRALGQSWEAVAKAIATEVRDHPDVTTPTAVTLMRWYSA